MSERERQKLLRRLAYITHGPGSRPKHEADGPDLRVTDLVEQLRALDLARLISRDNRGHSVKA